MVEEMDSRLKRCPCCGGETVLGSCTAAARG